MFKIMLVEDSQSYLSLLEHLVHQIDDTIEVLSCVDGLEAKNHFHAFSPDLVVTDICMPNVDGFELIPFLKENEDIVVVALTSTDLGYDGTTTTLDMATSLGADYAVCKSNLLKDFIHIVKSVINEKV